MPETEHAQYSEFAGWTDADWLVSGIDDAINFVEAQQMAHSAPADFKFEATNHPDSGEQP